MSIIERVVKKFEPLWVESGGELYLPIGKARKFVKECTENGVAVIGFDFVTLEDDSVIPKAPINSADWSSFLHLDDWNEVVLRCNSASLKILTLEERDDPEQFCTFVLYDQSRWAEDHTGGQT